MLQHKTLLREIYLQSQICNLKGIKIYSLTKRIGPKEESQFAKYTGGPVPPQTKFGDVSNKQEI